ncbi:MAG: hypothetical protein ACRCYS_05895, partial [Beijerinckiaceae bacterium]
MTALDAGFHALISRGDFADIVLTLWALCATLLSAVLVRALILSNRALAQAAADIAEAQDNARAFVRELSAFNRAHGV